MALKPIPKAIIILAAVGAIGFGVNAYLKTSPKVVAQSTQSQPQSSVLETKIAKVFSSTSTATTDSLKTILESGVVKVAVQSPSKPFFFDDGHAQGFNIDFMKILFQQPAFGGVNIKIDTSRKVDTYEAVPKTLLDTGNDQAQIAIDGLTFSNSDLDGVVYTIPYVEDFGYSLITSGTSSIKPGDNLDGLQIGILKGDSDVKAYAMKQFPKATLVELSDEAVNGGGRDWINRFIKEGRVDGIIYDYPFAVAEIAGTKLQFASTKLEGSDIKYKIALRKGDDKLLEALNMSIRKAKEDPQYSELIRKYFMSANTVAVKKATTNEVIYIVQKGDTLSTIAEVKLGDRTKYRLIETRNNLPNPNLISVGQKLVLPS